jgi:RNA 3'-terminal phosphate cyclase (ATP)
MVGEELEISNIRAKRPKPGLRPQHLAALEALRQMCRGRVEGARVGSSNIHFEPGGIVSGGGYTWDIGTAGSTTLLAMSILPVATFALHRCIFHIAGGLFQDFAPSAYHMQEVFFPVLKMMGINADLEIIRPGYVPRGGGIIDVTVEPVREKLKPIDLPEQGRVISVQGIALASKLKGVSERMVEGGRQVLKPAGYKASFSMVDDDSALQRGAAFALYAKTDAGCILGSDRSADPQRKSEDIGEHAARSLVEDLRTGACVDRYLADQLILYAALADGVSRYRIPRLTEHIEANLWLAETILGAKADLTGNLLTINGVGFMPAWKKR